MQSGHRLGHGAHVEPCKSAMRLGLYSLSIIAYNAIRERLADSNYQGEYL